jgi:hypothetical protein
MYNMSPHTQRVPDVVARAAAGDRVAVAELLERLNEILAGLPAASAQGGP